MAETLDHTTIHRRLSEARTYSYLLAATSSLLAITVLINTHLFEAHRQILQARLTTYGDVVNQARAAIDHIRDYFALHQLMNRTDRENTRTIADAVAKIQKPARKISRALASLNKVDDSVSVELLGFLVDPEEPSSEIESRFQHPIVPSDELEVLPLNQLVTLSFYVGADVLTIGPMLHELASSVP